MERPPVVGSMLGSGSTPILNPSLVSAEPGSYDGFSFVTLLSDRSLGSMASYRTPGSPPLVTLDERPRLTTSTHAVARSGAPEAWLNDADSLAGPLGYDPLPLVEKDPEGGLVTIGHSGDTSFSPSEAGIVPLNDPHENASRNRERRASWESSSPDVQRLVRSFDTASGSAKRTRRQFLASGHPTCRKRAWRRRGRHDPLGRRGESLGGFGATRWLHAAACRNDRPDAGHGRDTDGCGRGFIPGLRVVNGPHDSHGDVWFPIDRENRSKRTGGNEQARYCHS